MVGAQMNHIADLQYEARSRTANDEFIDALASGGDSRLVVDRLTGGNKYMCPPTPAPALICASSCTASPIAPLGFQRAADFYFDLVATMSPPRQAQKLEQRRCDIVAGLLGYFGVADSAEAILCPSGTDALLTAATLLAAEQPCKPITAILPVASETGSGVPLAVAGRWFDGVPPPDTRVPDCVVSTVEIPLRTATGTPRSDEEVVDAYAAAAAAARGRPIVYLTHSTKTGLIAPVTPPPGTDIIVDACQARIEPPAVARYLRKGWPVVVTGSKFFGGPAFSGAVLFPAARLPAASRRTPPNLGMLLRWIAALDTIEAFAPLAARMRALLQDRAAMIERGLGANIALVPMGGLRSAGSGWSDLPSIFTFAVRDPADERRLLSAPALRPLYEKLAGDGVLLGQPVGLGQFGGLRIAVGARDLLAGAPRDGGLPRLFSALEEATRL